MPDYIPASAFKPEQPWSILDTDDVGAFVLFQSEDDSHDSARGPAPKLEGTKTGDASMPVNSTNDRIVIDVQSLKKRKEKICFFDLPPELRIQIYEHLCVALETRWPPFDYRSPSRSSHRWVDAYHHKTHQEIRKGWNQQFKRYQLVNRALFRPEFLETWAGTTLHQRFLEIEMTRRILTRGYHDALPPPTLAQQRTPVMVPITNLSFAQHIFIALRSFLMDVEGRYGVGNRVRHLRFHAQLRSEQILGLPTTPQTQTTPLELLQQAFNPNAIAAGLERLEPGEVIHPEFRLEVEVLCTHPWDCYFRYESRRRARRTLVFALASAVDSAGVEAAGSGGSRRLGGSEWVCVAEGECWYMHVREKEGGSNWRLEFEWRLASKSKA